MNLYLISQTEVDDYDTYDSAVVAAENEEEARNTRLCSEMEFDMGGAWASSPENVEVKLIGKAIEGTKAGVILDSFNAG